ncbi:hypothetical protein C8J56DRAFT_1034897 [Mycena floridula]|nr:hypothetical protein C8J56DRAFT_1034897 [Mycena floridula]
MTGRKQNNIRELCPSLTRPSSTFSLVKGLGAQLKVLDGYSASELQREICEKEEKAPMMSTESTCCECSLLSPASLSIQGPARQRRNALLRLTRTVE